MKNYSKFFLVSLFLITFNSMFGQITIGLDEAPAKAALLQLKNKPSGNDGVTSTQGGLILSRVALKSITTLEPFISPSASDYKTQKSLHIGLLVYNVLTQVDINDSSITIYPGVYVWNGEKWEKLEM